MLEVIIIGAGPAGIAAAVQLKKYNIRPAVFEYGNVGGLLLNANSVENYPGFTEGISGVELARLFEKHLLRTGAEIIPEKVISAEYGEDGFEITTPSRVVRSKTLIVASGTKAKAVAFPRIAPPASERVFSEIAALIGSRGKSFVIIGAGDAAFDYALSLALGNRVTILNRSGAAKCNPALWEKASESQNIEYLNHSAISEARFIKGRLSLICSRKNTGENITIESDFIITAVGREPNLNFIGTGLKLATDELTQSGRLHFIGDVKNDIYRQTAVCVGDGVKAAMKIHEFLKTN